MAKSRIMRSPKTAHMFNQVCALRTDNISFSWGWAFVDEDTITISMQVTGKPCTESVSITKRDFNRLIRWYEKPTAWKANGNG